MHPVLPAPVLSYLKVLEVHLKHRFGVRVEEALSDAREHLLSDYNALHQSKPGIDDASCLLHFTESYGDPLTVAERYGLAKSPKGRPGIAPGWRICCSRCGLSAPAAEAGMTRIGAVSYHKYIGGWCRNCHAWRWFRVIHDLDDSNLTEQLSMNRTPTEVYARMHKPWTTVILILGLIAVIQLIVFGSISIALWFRQ